MNEEEMFEQLYTLISDRRSLMSDDKEASKIFEKDIKAIETIIENYKTNKMCLKGYRESILRQCENQLSTVEDIMIENNKLQQRIDKTIKIFEGCKMLMPHEFDWGEQIDNALEILRGNKDE